LRAAGEVLSFAPRERWHIVLIVAEEGLPELLIVGLRVLHSTAT
jgi:hypothetical protein